MRTEWRQFVGKFIRNRSPKKHARLMASMAHWQNESIRREWFGVRVAYDIRVALSKL